ncbi:DUF1214 domain-containing protein [Kitasatospora sp. MAA19]|uniref:DUF1214 domain-containing protein n=1 Tax=Kitasatospora sp. MAA19 TaxID=3035090 RepID=UPI0024748F0A|nr:DUF1214 domain-containing protein [Kitasatospora sp. MAA19]
MNGWIFDRTGVGTYGTDYDQRAYIAWTALGANLPQDAIYQNTIAQAADGNGNRIRYTLHLPALPTVEAFWSVTAYGADSFPVENIAKIYSLGHQIPPGAADPLESQPGRLLRHRRSARRPQPGRGPRAPLAQLAPDPPPR